MTLITTYAQRLQAAGAATATIGGRVRALRHADRHLPHGLDAACGDEITAYLATRRTANSRCTYYYALRDYYTRMVRAQKLTLDPMAAVDRPKPAQSLPNPVTNDQLRTALELSPDAPWRAAVILAAYAGLRCSELCRITCADVTEASVRVVQGKGGKDRYVPTHPLVWELRQERGSGHLVVDRRGQPTTMPRLSCTQGRHWARIGLPKNVHLHRFRHWFGTSLAEQEVSVDVIRELMGHANVQTTLGYIRVSQRRRAAAITLLPVMRHEPDGSRLVPPAAEAA